MQRHTKHKIALATLLQIVYKKSKNDLIFKWWTSMMFFLGLDRFSVDLDFEYIGNDKENLYKELEKSIIAWWFQIKESYIKSNTIFFLVGYWLERSLKIEISTRNFIACEHNEYTFYWEKIPVIDRETQVSFKIVALATRNKSRDIYDTNFFIEKSIFPDPQKVEELFRNITWKKKSYKEILKICIKNIEKDMNEKNIMIGLGELLDDKKRTQTKESLKNQILIKLNSLM